MSGTRIEGPFDDWHHKPVPTDLNAVVREAVGLLSSKLAQDERFAGDVLAFVVNGLTAEERDAALASYNLGGPEGLSAMLNDHFGQQRWVPFRFVRLLPPREAYSFMQHSFTFKQEVGWCQVGAALAMACLQVNAEERTRVFEVSLDPPSGRVAQHKW